MMCILLCYHTRTLWAIVLVLFCLNKSKYGNWNETKNLLILCSIKTSGFILCADQSSYKGVFYTTVHYLCKNVSFQNYTDFKWFNYLIYDTETIFTNSISNSMEQWCSTWVEYLLSKCEVRDKSPVPVTQSRSMLAYRST